MVATALVGLVSHPDPCRKALPRGPAVPAPIILRTTCGDFELGSDGKVSRMRRHWLRDWLAVHPSSPRYGRGLTVSRNRAGRIFVLRDKQVIWQSRLYLRDGGAVLFGQNAFAFASYRRGIFLTDLKGPEKLAARGRGLYPFNFTSTGELLVSGPRAITVVSSTGKALRRYRYRQITGYAFDETSDTLFFGTPDGMLVSAHGSDVRLVRPLRGIGGMMSILQPSRLLVFEGEHSVFVIRRDGSFVARAGWPRTPALVADSGVSVSPDGQTFVYRLTNVYPGSKGGRGAVYVLHAGETKAHPVYGHRMGPGGCGVGADLTWHGPFVMYRSTDGNLAAIDTRSSRVWKLTSFMRSLPGLPSRTTSYAAGYWASDFGQS
jgi:hypothetical protein